MKIPFFECPDEEITTAWSFRWETFLRHLRETPEGWVITEFLPDVPWAGPYNTISCAASPHVYDGRWLSNGRYTADYLRFWLKGSGAARSYSFSVGDALLAHCYATGDWALGQELLPELIANYREWEQERLDADGLFWQIDDRDGMEYSISGVGNRLTINSYMYADAKAIARLYLLSGDREGCRRFTLKAEKIRDMVTRLLWDKEQRFFKTRSLARHREMGRKHYGGDGHVGGTNSDGLSDALELTGYIPWCYGLPGNEYADAWQYLPRPDVFDAPYGLTTADMRHPKFMVEIPHDCLWNGPVWPYATSQTLTAMIRLLNDCEQETISAAHFTAQLKKYASCMWITRENGVRERWIDENLHPFTGRWLARDKRFAQGDLTERGEAYNHSTFCDLVITGLCGLNAFEKVAVNPLCDWPFFQLTDLSFRGVSLDIVYDRDGSKYSAGKGLSVYADGQMIGHTDELKRLAIEL